MRSPQRQRTAGTTAAQIRTPDSPARFAGQVRRPGSQARFAGQVRSRESRQHKNCRPREEMGLAGSHRPRAPTRPASWWVPDSLRIHPAQRAVPAAVPKFCASGRGSTGPPGLDAAPAPGPAGPQVMRGGYIADTFNSRGGGSPECGHNVDVSEAC
jgi:hypothetical protein